MKMTYKPVKGSHITNEQAQRYGEALHAIEEETGGKLTAQAIVENAKEKENPLHDFFEWDNKKAALEYRLEQARRLARSISIDVQDTPTRAFQFVREQDGAESYANAKRVFSTADMRAQVVKRALAELEGWRKRWSQYQEFSKIFAAIEEMKAAE